jgi:hypothetical protein
MTAIQIEPPKLIIRALEVYKSPVVYWRRIRLVSGHIRATGTVQVDAPEFIVGSLEIHKALCNKRRGFGLVPTQVNAPRTI